MCRTLTNVSWLISFISIILVSRCTDCDIILGSRRLITYRRIPDAQVEAAAIKAYEQAKAERAVEEGKTADDLNPFRNAYFKGFKN